MSAHQIELIQFPHSHFNEKARWALDWKRAVHRRTNLLPGPHAGRVRKLAGGTTTPVVVFDGGVVQGSARIIDELERRFPDPPLYPVDPAERERALEIQRWFDEEIGPKVRLALFSVMLNEGGYMCRMFGEGHAWPARMLYRSMFPVASRMIRKEYRLDDVSAVEAAFGGAREGLDFVAKQAAASGHLVGEGFSVADLTAAALLAPCCDPPDCAMTKPVPVPESIDAFMARFSGHPGVGWVLQTYARWRSPSVAVR